jgi:splicing factor 3B subunit 1
MVPAPRGPRQAAARAGALADGPPPIATPHSKPQYLSSLADMAEGQEEPSGFNMPAKIVDREDDYKKRRFQRIISPDRNDAFITGDKTPDARVSSYADVMRKAQLNREEDNTRRNIEIKQRLEQEEAAGGAPAAQAQAPAAEAEAPAVGGKRRNRWDQSASETDP